MQINIIHISDIHCNNEMLNKIIKLNYDILISSGDFECLESAELFSNANNTFAVSGNMDDVSIMKLLSKNGILLDGKIKRINNITIAGIGGIDPRTNITSLRNELTKSNYKIDILISHNPPYGILDMTYFKIRAGLKELKELSEFIKPKLHLFGHIHESQGIKEINKTTYINPGPLYLGSYAEIILNQNVIAKIKNIANL
ncbi:metallophosphoesterase family protein [Caldisphaera sp.]|uniref:metallophosphoesterase family protein n=1 Tax=Caldisphaera sp. TaxID=2060322 RepID=UPI0025B8190F|nr:metallophosphoesterase family protein [Caldisphaera sp.]